MKMWLWIMTIDWDELLMSAAAFNREMKKIKMQKHYNLTVGSRVICLFYWNVFHIPTVNLIIDPTNSSSLDHISIWTIYYWVKLIITFIFHDDDQSINWYILKEFNFRENIKNSPKIMRLWLKQFH